MSFGKSIELFLVNGTADSIITAELSNWNGKAKKYHALRFRRVRERMFAMPEYISYFARMMMGQILFTSEKPKI